MTIHIAMTMRKVLEDIYADTDGLNGGNFGAIVLEDEILIVDSGMIHPKSRIEREFLESEIGLPIKKLIFTHSHSDHVFGAQSFEPVLLIASVPTRNRCQDNLKNDWQHASLIENYSQVQNERPELWASIPTLRIRPPDVAFDDQIEIGVQGQINVQLTGGHTSGSSVVISKEHDIVFIGDLIFKDRFPYGGDPSCDPDRWIDALEEISKNKFKAIIPGHGAVCTQKDLNGYLIALKELRRNVKSALEQNISPDTFVEQEMIPELLKTGFERFGSVTLKHWFEIYS